MEYKTGHHVRISSNEISPRVIKTKSTASIIPTLDAILLAANTLQEILLVHVIMNDMVLRKMQWSWQPEISIDLTL